MRSTKIIKIYSSSLCTCLLYMVILRSQNKITDFLMILAWASSFNHHRGQSLLEHFSQSHGEEWSLFLKAKGGGPGAVVNPLTAGVAYIRFFTQLLPHSVPLFKHVKAIMWHQSAIFENSWPPLCQIWIIFTHLKLWIASARHNFKWVKIQIE